MVAIAMVTATVLVLVHLLIGHLHLLDVLPRSWWLSVAGGIAVAYIFLHLLPSLAAHQTNVGPELSRLVGFIEGHIYVLALAGLVTFYGLEHLARTSRLRRQDPLRAQGGQGAFWVHIGSFALYNALIGYLLLHLEEPTIRNTLFFGAAMALHSLVADYGLHQHHRHAYDHPARWVLAGAVLLGLAIGYFTRVSDVVVAILSAFLAGGLIVNILKEELPAERESRFAAFLVGATASSFLLLAL